MRCRKLTGITGLEYSGATWWKVVTNGARVMYRGIAGVNIDTKGRMAIPTRYRDDLIQNARGQLVVTIDTEDRCLLLYPLPEWEKIEAKIEALPSFNRMARRIQRLLIGHACETEMDSQGRILLPLLLREYAGLDKEVMLVGQGKRFEIWGEAQWTLGREGWLAEEPDKEGDIPPELESLSL